ncbi:MAG: S9 family peptidase [Candidatus Neomarinimicrobiota bacterium]
MMRKLIIIALITLLGQPAAGKARMTFEDLYGFPLIKNLALSPDGKTLALTIQVNDIPGNRKLESIWMMKTNGRDLRQVSPAGYWAWKPRWSADGQSLAYLLAGSTADEVWVYNKVSGENSRLTGFASDITDFIWFPIGGCILFAAETFTECGTDADCIRRQVLNRAGQSASGRTYDQLLFRHYKTWENGAVSHVFRHDFATDKIIDLTPGTDDAPGLYLGGNCDLAVHPAGSLVVFTMNTDSVLAISTNNDIFTVNCDGTARKRVSAGKGNDTDPRFSPDGRYLAYARMARAGYESDQCDLVIVDMETGAERNLTAALDRSVDEIIWSTDSRSIYFNVGDRALTTLYRVTLEDGKITRLFGDIFFEFLNVSADQRYLYCSASEPHRPPEVYRVDLKNGALKQLTSFGADLVEKVSMSPAATFWFSGADGDSVMGLLTYPPDFKPQKKYPLVLLIHGGPQALWYKYFNFYGWNTQLLTAQGYIVAQINPHGSGSYGIKFKEAVSGDWAGRDFTDLMLGLDYLIATQTAIDPDRLAALGRSYGGYMINWINGHSDRFRCLVTIDGTFDKISSYYSTEELWFPEWDFAGTPWTNRELYLERSPSTYVEHFRTPTLVIHGGLDYRVDPAQGLSVFTALRRRGIPAQLLYYPDEGHSILKLQNLKQSYQVQLEWLARWLKQ